MINKIIILKNEQASVDWAEQLAPHLRAPMLLTFSGDLGAGKTTLIRAMLKKLGVESPVKSPTYSLVESYQANGQVIHHFDLYRVAHEEELDYLGFRDYFTQSAICCIEWAEHAGKALPKSDIQFTLSNKGSGREMQIIALSEAGKRILDCLPGES